MGDNSGSLLLWHRSRLSCWWVLPSVTNYLLQIFISYGCSVVELAVMFYGCICIWYLNHCLFNLYQILNCDLSEKVLSRTSGLWEVLASWGRGRGEFFICFNRFDLRLANIVPKLSCSSVVIQNMLRDSVHFSRVSGCGGWQSEQAISSFSQKLFYVVFIIHLFHLCLLLTFFPSFLSSKYLLCFSCVQGSGQCWSTDPSAGRSRW